MTESNTTLHAALARLTTLSFAEAYAAIHLGDPLGLRERIAVRLDESALWLPIDAVMLRAARTVARQLSTSLPEGDGVDAWMTALILRAVVESSGGHQTAEAEEWDAWADHVSRVAARFGIDAGLGSDALALFHELAQDDRGLLLLGMRLASERRIKELSNDRWARFTELWRGIVRAVTLEE